VTDRRSRLLGGMYFPAGIPFAMVVAVIVYNAIEEKKRSDAARKGSAKPS
jgi:hypothetical protein